MSSMGSLLGAGMDTPPPAATREGEEVVVVAEMACRLLQRGMVASPGRTGTLRAIFTVTNVPDGILDVPLRRKSTQFEGATVFKGVDGQSAAGQTRCSFFVITMIRNIVVFLPQCLDNLCFLFFLHFELNE